MSKIYEALNRAEDNGGDPPAKKGERPDILDPHTLPPELREVWSHYEELHSSIDKSLDGVAGHSLLFASSVEQEGSTTVAVEYASTLGRTVHKGCLLVDANLRSPSLHDIFEVPNENGIAEVISGKCKLKSAVVPVAQNSLSILPAGNAGLSPSTLLTMGAMSRFLAEAGEMFGLVLVDSPPVIAYAEATHLAGSVDGVVFVVESEKTKREIVLRARDAMLEAKANILGVVMNRRRYVIPEFLYRQL